MPGIAGNSEAVSEIALQLSVRLKKKETGLDGTNATGKASLRRSADLSERFRVITQDIRTFHAHTARVAASRQFRLTLVTCSNGDLQ